MGHRDQPQQPAMSRTRIYLTEQLNRASVDLIPEWTALENLYSRKYVRVPLGGGHPARAECRWAPVFRVESVHVYWLFFSGEECILPRGWLCGRETKVASLAMRVCAPSAPPPLPSLPHDLLALVPPLNLE